MSTAAAGQFTQFAYKINGGAFGAAPGQSGGQALRRNQASFALKKDTYRSQEIRSDFQIADFSHGVRRVNGKLTGELSCKTWADFIAIALKRDFTAGVSESAVGVTVAAGSGTTWTLTRSAGNFLTAGWKVGRVMRLSVGGLNAANINKNLQIVALTATVMTVSVVNGTAMVAEGPITGCTLTEIGKSTWIPTTGHTDKDFGLEGWYSDIAQSELYLGNKCDKVSLSLPPTGNAMIDIDVIGQDMAETAAKRGGVATTTQYFTSPTAATTTAVMAAVNGVLRSGGNPIATLTGLTIDIDPTFTGDPVVGLNIIPQLFPGEVSVTGQFTAYFDSVALRDAFIAATDIDLIGCFTADGTATSDFIAFGLPRLKLGDAAKTDGNGGIVQTFPFQALLNLNGGTGTATDRTTIFIQDSQA